MRYLLPILLLLPAFIIQGCDTTAPGDAPSEQPGAEAVTNTMAGVSKSVAQPVDQTVEAEVEANQQQSGRSLPQIAFEHYQLANGLNVILHVDDKMPAVNVNLWYHVGSKNEEPGKTGFAHLFEHMMFQNSKHSEGEYLALAERAGASLGAGGVNGTTNNDRTNYFQTVPTGSLEYVLWLESDRMGFLLDAVTQESFDNQRNVVKNEKRQGDNRPYSSQQYIIADNMFPTAHPYSHTVIGSLEDLDNASIEDVKRFFKQYYAPNNASLTLSGNFDPEQARELIQKYFGPLPSGQTIVRQHYNIPRLNSDIKVVVEERLPQPKLTLVWHTPPWFDKEEAPLDFAAEILGEGKNSRLYRRLVRDEKLATQVTVYNATREISGLFYVQVMATPNASLDRIGDIVAEELEKLAQQGPTEEEMQQRHAQHEYRFVSALERIGGFGGKADQLNAYWTYLRDPGSFERDYRRYQQVSVEAVSRSLQTWITGANKLEIRFLPDSSGMPDAAEFDRTQPPAFGAEPDFSAPELASITLDNGLSLLVLTRSDLPKVEVAMIFKGGDLGETRDNAGLSHLTAAAVDDGTSSRTSVQIQAELKSLGSSLGSGGNKFGSVVRLSTLRKNLEASIDILADVVLNPTFPEDEVALTRELRVNQIRQEKSNPSRLANKLFPRLLFTEGHPAGIPAAGTAESIATLTPAQLAENHNSFWRPNNAALVMVGDITAEEARRLGEKYFADWRPEKIPEIKHSAPKEPTGTRVFLLDKPGVPQSQIRIGSLAPPRSDPDYATLQIMNELLGGPFASRLNLNLREDKGYSYGVSSHIAQRKHFGYWVAMGGVETSVTAPSLQEFRTEIEGMSGSIPIGDDELGDLKTSLGRAYMQNFATLSQVVREVTPLVTSDIPLDYLQQYIDEVQQQSTSDINASARQYLDMDKAVVLVVGDLDVIETAVMSMNWGDVVVIDEDGEVIRKGGDPSATDRPDQ